MPCLQLGLDAEEAHDAERLFNEAACGGVAIELVQTSSPRDRADEADGCGDDLLDDRVAVDALNDEVEHIVASERVVELGDINEGSLRPGLLDELVDGVTVLVDLGEVLGAPERDTELEGILAGVEVTLALGLSGRHDDGEVTNDFVEVLVDPLGAELIGRGSGIGVDDDGRDLIVVSEVGVVKETVGLVDAEVVTEERDSILVQLEGESESGTVGLVGGSLLTDGGHTLLLEFTREDALREADDGALFVVPVVSSERRLSMVAIRTDRASQFADAEDDAFLEPFTDGGAAKEFVGLASLGHDRDETVHPVLQELDRHLVGRDGYAVVGHSVHDRLEVHVRLHADAEAFKGLNRVHDAFCGIKCKTLADLLVGEVVEVFNNRLSKHFRVILSLDC